MLTTLITLLIVALVLLLVFYIAGWFIQGKPLQIIGAILALIWLLYALRSLGVLAF